MLAYCWRIRIRFLFIYFFFLRTFSFKALSLVISQYSRYLQYSPFLKHQADRKKSSFTPPPRKLGIHACVEGSWYLHTWLDARQHETWFHKNSCVETGRSFFIGHKSPLFCFFSPSLPCWDNWITSSPDMRGTTFFPALFNQLISLSVIISFPPLLLYIFYPFFDWGFYLCKNVFSFPPSPFRSS